MEVNVPSEDELRALFDKGGFDAVQADAEAAAGRDAKQILSDAFAEMNFPVPVLAEPDQIPSPQAITGSLGEALESTNTNLKRTARKWHADSSGGEKNHPKCEFPKPTGKGICGKPATQIVTISGFRWSYNAKACDKCAAYVEKEARANASKDS